MNKIKRIWTEKPGKYMAITIGAWLMSIAVVNYFDPTEAVPGGVTGIAIILKNLFRVPMWLTNLMVNIPLFVLAYRMLDKNGLKRTLYGAFILTVFLAITPLLDIRTGEMLVDIITGGAFMGLGLGIVFMSNASSGGTDLAATLLNIKVRYLSIPKIMAIIDALIVAAGIGAFGIKNGVYSIIAIIVVTRVSDYVIEGPDRAKLLYIISDRYEELARYIIHELDRGASYIDISGVYTNETKKMILCVTSTREMVKLKEKVYETDRNAICFIEEIKEAYGEGFTRMGE